MHGFLENLGLLAIFFIIVYGYKKILEYYELKRAGLHEDKRVYAAADKFAHGTSPAYTKVMLEDCFKLDNVDVEKILAKAVSHRSDKDGGYRAFIRAVNKEFGDDVYDERYKPSEASAQQPSEQVIISCPPSNGQNK